MAMPEYSLSAIETMLRELPRAEFRARLRRDLERMGTTMMTTAKCRQQARSARDFGR
jgi:hypothetical protein